MSLSPRRNPAHTGSVPYSYSVVLKVTGTTLSYDSFWGAALTQPISSCSFAAAGPEVGDTLPLICPDIANAMTFNPHAARLLLPPYLGLQLVAFFVFDAMAREVA